MVLTKRSRNDAAATSKAFLCHLLLLLSCCARGFQPSQFSQFSSLSVRETASRTAYLNLDSSHRRRLYYPKKRNSIFLRYLSDSTINEPHSNNKNNNNKKAQDDDDRGDKGRRRFLARVVQRAVLSCKALWSLPSTARARWAVVQTRFRALPKRAQRIVLVYLLSVVLAFGGMIHVGVTARRGAGPDFGSAKRPIEIAYSSFLDLVEHPPTMDDSVRIDQVRIGSDRITYRLYYNKDQIPFAPTETKKTLSASSSSASSSKDTTSSLSVQSKNNMKGRSNKPLPTNNRLSLTSNPASPKEALTLPRKSNKHASTDIIRTPLSSERQSESSVSSSPSSFVMAYTRHMPAVAAASNSDLIPLLRNNQIRFSAALTPKWTAASVLASALRSFIVALYAMFLIRLYRNMTGGGGGGGLGGGGKDMPGKLAGKRGSRTDDSIAGNASFDDIQGIDQAKAEVMELVDTLKYPDKYSILGARAPTGLLLEGPPGTGKTLLARATAAAAGVPLLYCSGSDFVEVFVGRGAARIRNLFERAEKLAPCIVFIDELDALGKARDGVFGGASPGFSRNDEAEQTINQLLACMDGLDSSRQVVVLAATNRKDVLDPALIRPGRFDRIVQLKLPNAAGREAILRVHCQKLPGFLEGSGVDPDRAGSLGKGRRVDLSAIAAITEGLSGAELEFIVNEAAIRAVRRVSAALRLHGTNSGTSPDTLTPHVTSEDFEASLRNFFETRRPRNNAVSDLLKNVWKA